MRRYLITLEVENGFYQEAKEEGLSTEKLLHELELEIQDQLEEYDLSQLLSGLVSAENQEDAVIVAPRKDDEVASSVGALCL